MIRTLAVSLMSLGVALSATAAENTTTDSVATKLEAKANQALGVRSVAVDFAKNSANLSARAKQNLDALVKAARDTGSIDKVHVAAWSDQAFPAREQELSEADRKLAQQRNENIEKYLEQSLKVNGVETYSMAERSNWLAQTFDTDEAELKSLFSKSEPTPLTNEGFQEIKKKGQPSKAVVLISL